MLASRARSGKRSGRGYSHQSTSLFCSAALAVAPSGMTVHSMRGKKARLAPVAQTAGSWREIYWSNFSYTTRLPETYSSALKR